MAIMTGKELAAACMDVAQNYKTLYIMGCFGAPMTAKGKKRYANNHSYNRQQARTAMIQAASSDTFGFDCVGLIKGLLWGWRGDNSKVYGGAKYKANGVGDHGANGMIKKCSDLSMDFNDIQAGEAVWLDGHIGIYIGDGLAVECSPKWANGVQITACNCRKEGYKTRTWTKHGKLPWVEYEADKPQVIYRVFADGRWLPEVTGTEDHAGIFGKEVSGLQVRLSDGQTVTVRSHIKGRARLNWLPAVYKWDSSGSGYSGIKGRPLDGIAMKAEGSQLRYRVHTVGGGWLPWVSGYNILDYAKGLAGIYGKSIDGVQIDAV